MNRLYRSLFGCSTSSISRNVKFLELTFVRNVRVRASRSRDIMLESKYAKFKQFTDAATSDWNVISQADVEQENFCPTTDNFDHRISGEVGAALSSTNAEISVSNTIDSFESWLQDRKARRNRFRQIVYDEGELEKSDLTKPPSRSNPHPFDPSSDPSLLPATHSWTLVQYVNHIPMLQVLVELGVNLFEIDTNTNIGRHLLRLDWHRDVKPKLLWLIRGIGVPVTTVGSYLTRNPYFLLQNLDNMKIRARYLKLKRFKKEEITKIVINSRFWLNTDVKIVDERLGWLQRTFELTGHDVRKIITKEPRVISFGIGPIERLVDMFNKDLDFTIGQIKAILFDDPRVFMMDAEHVRLTYNYLSRKMRVTNAQIVDWPQCLRCSVAAIRRRHEFLVKIRKEVIYAECSSRETVSLADLLQPSDRTFATEVARTFVAVYNSFLKNY